MRYFPDAEEWFNYEITYNYDNGNEIKWHLTRTYLATESDMREIIEDLKTDERYFGITLRKISFTGGIEELGCVKGERK